MKSELSVCFVGLGSIGKRHLRNLFAICAERGISLLVDALRHTHEPLDPEIATYVHHEIFDAGRLSHYDVIFVCNPSQLHYETLVSLQDKADSFFVEKPLFTRPLTDDELRLFLDERKYYVACPLRHTKTFAELKNFVSSHAVYSVRAICSSYLPEWRPGTDYRKLYAASKESGGVALDLIHEFDYLFSLFGFPVDSKLIARHVSNLEIESPDVVSYVASYPNKTLELHLDYFGRESQRFCEIFSSEETLRFDFLRVNEERNESYLREMRQFLDFAAGVEENINPVRFANDVLRHVLTIRPV